MSTNLWKKAKRRGQEAGVALITTLLLMFLMSSLLIGFTILLISNQQLEGSNNDDVSAFYGAEAGMEQLTASLGNLFSQTYAPTSSQITALETNNPGPPAIPGISFLTGSGASGYQIQYATNSSGNPVVNNSTIKAGPYAGMGALITDYNLYVNARTATGREVLLERTTETVGIPMFQFAIFCEVDCSFHAGQDFTISGRVHGNGNLFLASSSGVTLQMQGKVDAYKDIVREYMDNGASVSSNWPGTVSITTNPGGSSYRSLALTEGSVEGSSSSCDTNWPNISTGASPTDYGSNLINGAGSPSCKQYSTGADLLNLGIVTMGGGTTQPIDLIRRPIASENSNITGERYFAQASLAILLSDNPADIMNLPCVDQSTQPFDLSVLAQPVANWPTTGPYAASVLKLENLMAANGTIPLPLAASGSGNGTGTAYNATDGYWLPGGYPIVKGYLKIQAQTAYGSPCGTWKDVTLEILSLGYAGRNINPVPQSYNGTSVNAEWQYTSPGNMNTGVSPALPNAPASTVAQLGYQNGTSTTQLSTSGTRSPTSLYTTAFESTMTNPYACPDPHPNAVIRLERIRDNPSSVYYNSGALKTTAPTNYPYQSNMEEVCGVNASTTPVALAVTRNTGTTWVPQPYDFWNNTLFDTREGELRDTTPSANYVNLPTLNGTMHYVELDVGNLVKWFNGTIGTSGTSTKDPVTAPNDFSIYFSDRRGNYAASQTWTGSWPPLSPTTHETGEYGWNDFANPGDATNGCPNNALDGGEDLDSLSTLFTYGAATTNINYIMFPGSPTAENLLYTLSGGTTGSIIGTNTTTGGINGAGAYGEFGMYTVATLTTGATPPIKANPNCAAPTYTNGIWPMMYVAASNAARENPPIFFRRVLKLTDANNLTGLGWCYSSPTSCGLAIASENPVYMQGDFNADYTNPGTSGFSDTSVGSSIAADAVTILSNSWNDENSFSYGLYCMPGNGCTAGPRIPTQTWYRVAVVGGKGVSFPEFGSDADNGTDGGVHNFLRYLEAWGNGTSGVLNVNYMGALVNLNTNRQLTGIFKCCVTVYSVPNRVYSFDSTFLSSSSLPPRTPLFRDVDTTGWTRIQSASQGIPTAP